MSKDMTEALRLMMEERTDTNVTASLKPRGAAEPAKSAAIMQAKTGGGSGIASPLTEQSFAARTYHPTPYTSSDGLFTFPATKQITMLDANNNEVKLVFASPP